MAHFALQDTSQPSDTQPDGTTMTGQHSQQETPSTDPSTTSSNSGDMSGDQNHSKSASSYSDQSPSLNDAPGGVFSPAEKSLDAAAPAPSATMNGIESTSPNKFATRSPPRPVRTRARSSSSSMLARLTSRSSSYSNDYLDANSLNSTRDPNDSPNAPKIDRAALAKPKGKYKSGINFKSSPMNLAAGEEPFMEQATPYQRTEEEMMISLKNAEMELMAAAGSTKAALARAQSNSIGDPIFANHRRALADASAKAALAAAAAASLPQSSSSSRPAIRPKGASSVSPRSPSDNSRPSQLRFNAGEMNGISEDIASRNGSQEGSQSTEGQNLISEAAEHVLASAKMAARLSTDALNMSFTESQPDSSLSSNTIAKPEAPSPMTKQSRRRTFMGFGGGSAGKESKKEKKKKGGKNSKKEADESESANDQLDQDQIAGTEANGDNGNEKQGTSPSANSAEFRDTNSTVGRRRRFNDTRQLNMLASELAAEALLGAPENFSSLTPETRRASMMSMLAATNGEMGSSSADGSQLNLHYNGLATYPGLSMPQPAFASEFGRSGSPAASSSRSGSPRHIATDLPRFEPPRAPFARSQQSLSTPSSPLVNQKTKLNGLPSDMLTGLGDGPYPALPPRGLDLSDPFGIPIANDSAYDAHSQGRNSLPGNFNRSRNASAGSSSNPKRSVLQMSMHNPEAEMQGLTKPIKSGRSTPFGSRAPSRQVTPSPSVNGLRERANTSAQSAVAVQRQISPRTSNLESVTPPEDVLQDKGRFGEEVAVENEKDSSEIIAKGSKKKERPAAKARRSFFGKKSSKQPTEEFNGKSNSLLLPPSPPPASLLHFTSSDSQRSRPTSNLSNEIQNSSTANRSVQSLVKVPSATNTNTTTSASSHEPGAFAYSSSDGGSQRQGFSAVTTPEAMPVKSEIVSGHSMLQSTGNTLSPLAVDHDSTLSASPSKLESANATPTSASGPNPIKGSIAPLVNPSPRTVSSATKDSNTGTLKKKNKFKSFFATTKSGRNSPTLRSGDATSGLPFYHLSTGTSEKLDNGRGTNLGSEDVSPAATPAERGSTELTEKDTSRDRNFKDLVSHQSEQKNAGLVQAYINPQLAHAGFGTRSAYQSYEQTTIAISQ